MNLEDPKRTLSAAEQRRMDMFEQKREELSRQNYSMRLLTSSIVKANVLALLLWIPIGILSAVLYRLCGGEFYHMTLWSLFTLAAAYLVSIFIHEGLHGLTWGAIAGMDHIEYGLIKEALTPYCTCSEPIRKSAYILGALMPTIVLGVIPLILAIVLHNEWLLLYGNLMFMSGGGDQLIVLMLLKDRTGSDTVYLDHPTDLGLAVFEKEERT